MGSAVQRVFAFHLICYCCFEVFQLEQIVDVIINIKTSLENT